MRNRNKNFANNIGDLMEEINNQDLENVNGGHDNMNKPTINTTILTVISKPGAKCCGDITKKPLCTIVPILSKVTVCA